MALEKYSAPVRDVIEQARVTNEEVPVIVKFRSEQSKWAIRTRSDVTSTLTIKQDYHLIPATALSADLASLDRLSDADEVEVIWLDEPVSILLDVSTPLIRAPYVWEHLGYQGEGVTICVIDTGIDGDHPDFAGRIRLTADFTNKGSAADGNGHGTHVVSIVAGTGQASAGKYVGVAPAAMIMAAKVLTDKGSGQMSGVMAGLEWAARNGADVLNLSLGSEGSSDGSDALCTMCNAIVDLGKVVVVAAGNSGPRRRTIGSPGAAEKVITVGASTDRDRIARFSSRGPTADGRLKPDLVAPGSNIVAARAAATSMGRVVNAMYTSANGTSMAAPHVVGLCALMLQANPQLVPADIKSKLMNTCRDIDQDETVQGGGRVDALAALLEPGAPLPEPIPDPPPIPEPSPLPPGGGCLTAILRVFSLP